jgi:hypothetical protein
MPVQQTDLQAMPWTSDLMDIDEFRDWVASRKDAAATIDIETCELGRWPAYDCDVYGLRMARGELPEEMHQIGTNRFVRSPQSDGWVHEGDLSPVQVKAMYARIKREYREWEAAKPAASSPTPPSAA